LIQNKEIFFPNKAKHGIDMSDDAKDFISRCLEKNHKKRLGSKGTDEILNHKWFNDLDR